MILLWDSTKKNKRTGLVNFYVTYGHRCKKKAEKSNTKQFDSFFLLLFGGSFRSASKLMYGFLNGKEKRRLVHHKNAIKDGWIKKTLTFSSSRKFIKKTLKYNTLYLKFQSCVTIKSEKKRNLPNEMKKITEII